MFDHVEHGVELPTLTRKTTEEGRRYFTPDGSAYPSITTVLSILSKQAIIEWRKRVGEEEANRISRQASGRGTAVHKICEDYIDNVENWKGKHQPSNLFMFNTLKPVLDKKINNIWFQEVYLYSDKLKTAGQVDCIAEFEGELSVIDFKTSRRVKSEDNIQNYFMQISFYAAAFYEMTGIPIKQGVILIAVDDSEPQVFKFNTYDYLEHLVQVRKKYRALHEKPQVHNN
tara:strand:- start:6519 stop:7205 length:687 start_codon:yes stop_codon:yes gene_type:complete